MRLKSQFKLIICILAHHTMSILCILESFGQINHAGVLSVHRKNSASLQNTSNDDRRSSLHVIYACDVGHVLLL